VIEAYLGTSPDDEVPTGDDRSEAGA
jgi:hypothetical protein